MSRPSSGDSCTGHIDNTFGVGMPWKACSAMMGRLRFVARLLNGEGMSNLRWEFGISRNTGYKIYNRNKADRSAPHLYPAFHRPNRYHRAAHSL